MITKPVLTDQYGNELDVDMTGVADGDVLTYDSTTGLWLPAAPGGSGAPDDADYLVGTAHAGLTSEIVVGTTPGGELGGTWGSPTVDATHSGSAHTDFIAKSLVDAKGDLLVGTAADTVARQPVGSNDQVLIADSTQTNGVRWGSVSGGGGAGGAPAGAKYVTTEAHGDLSAEVVRQFLGNYYNETYPTSPDAMNDEFDDTANNSGTGNGLDGQWAWRNQGSATATFGKAGFITLNCPSESAGNMHSIEQNLSDGTYECYVAREMSSYANGSAGWCGFTLTDATNNDLYICGWGWDYFGVQRFTNVTTYSADIGGTNQAPMIARLSGFLRLIKSSTTISFWYSEDGNGWMRLVSFTETVTPTKIGLFTGERASSGLSKAHFDYFRKVA